MGPVLCTMNTVFLMDEIPDTLTSWEGSNQVRRNISVTM